MSTLIGRLVEVSFESGVEIDLQDPTTATFSVMPSVCSMTSGALYCTGAEGSFCGIGQTQEPTGVL